MKALIFLLIATLWQVDNLRAQEDPKTVYNRKVKGASPSTSLGELTLYMGGTFLGTPYVAHTLEGNATEKLVCRFDALDCTTLVDVSVALAIARKKQLTYEEFLGLMTKLRYSNGTIDGYASRQHYFLTWASENCKRGLMKDLSKDLGGIPYKKSIDFMSTHASLYAGITSETVLDQIKKNEQALRTQSFFYIPKTAVAAMESRLKNGDIIGITSTIPGLDCNHQGIISMRQNRAYLLHASTTAHEVIVSEQPLSEYLASVKRHSGIIVLRPNDTF